MTKGVDEGSAGGSGLSRRGEGFCLLSHGLVPQCIQVRYSAMGPRARAGMKVRAPTRMITAVRNSTKSGVCVGSVPAPAGICFLQAREPRRGQDRNHDPEAPHEHGQAEGYVVEEGVGVQSGKSAAVVVRCRGEGIENLGKAVGAGIEDPRKARAR